MVGRNSDREKDEAEYPPLSYYREKVRKFLETAAQTLQEREKTQVTCDVTEELKKPLDKLRDIQIVLLDELDAIVFELTPSGSIDVTVEGTIDGAETKVLSPP